MHVPVPVTPINPVCMHVAFPSPSPSKITLIPAKPISLSQSLLSFFFSRVTMQFVTGRCTSKSCAVHCNHYANARFREPQFREIAEPTLTKPGYSNLNVYQPPVSPNLARTQNPNLHTFQFEFTSVPDIGTFFGLGSP